jgi:hypothetical protein
MPVHHHHIGDILTPVGGQFKRPDGTVVDVTGKTIKFIMILLSDDTVKVAEGTTGVTITTALTGKVQKVFLAADVDTAEEYRAYFLMETSSSVQEHFPTKTRDFRIIIHAD